MFLVSYFYIKKQYNNMVKVSILGATGIIGKNVSFTDINQHWSIVMQELAI